MDHSASFNTLGHSHCLETLFPHGFHDTILSCLARYSYSSSFICLSSCPRPISVNISPTFRCFPSLPKFPNLFPPFNCPMAVALLQTFKLLPETIIHLPPKSLCFESLSVLLFCHFPGRPCIGQVQTTSVIIKVVLKVTHFYFLV